MTDDDEQLGQLGQLYRTAISQLPGGQPDPALARTTALTHRRNRRRVAGAVAAAAVAAAVVIVATPWPDSTEITAVPAGGGEPAVCPALLPGTTNAAVDYADAFRWNNQNYITSNNLPSPPKPGRLGRLVTTVTCSITELTADNGNLVANDPWPNGTATFLPTGTQVFAIRGVPTRCELGVPDPTAKKGDNTVKLFVAVRDPDWEPLC